MGATITYRVILLAIVFVVVASNRKIDHRRRCEPNERRVRWKPRKDTFCHPSLTLPSRLHKRRHCVCKSGYVRNAWGKCITIAQCRSCDRRLKQDFHLCRSPCLITCNKPIPPHCRKKQCVMGCACAPGYVRQPGRGHKSCIAAKVCPPRCPNRSVFSPCPSSCQPWCHRRTPRYCVRSCRVGDCVCLPGYAKIIQQGKTLCVPNSQCHKRKS